MDPATNPIEAGTGIAPGRVPRAVWHTVGLVVAALLAYAVWRGYQNPDLLLELSALRLC